jgi:hypothetical protein
VIERESAQDHRVDDREDRGGGADPERQHDQRGDGETGRGAERAGGVAEVGAEALE